MFPPFDSLLRLVGAVRCDQNDTRLSATSFIDRRTLEAGHRREALVPSRFLRTFRQPN